MTSQNDFRDQAVIITGASSGIGRALALLLADQGARLALAARDASRLEALAAECAKRGGKAVAIPTDVGDQEACRRLVLKASNELSGLHMLVCNAGLSMVARFEDLETLEPLEEILRVNYLGCVYLTYYALPQLKKSQGRIVGVASLTAKTGVPTRTGYAASKHAMAGFFDSLRIELEGTGVSVTMVYPDYVATEVRERAFGPDGKPLGKSPVKEGRVMTAEACARIIAKAAAERRREAYTSLRGRLGPWLRLLSPSLVDGMARRAVEKGR